MVGTTGFEPATSRTPSVRATRLRYVPTGNELPAASAKSRDQARLSVSLAFEKRQQFAQRVTQIEQHLAADRGLRRAGWPPGCAATGARAGAAQRRRQHSPCRAVCARSDCPGLAACSFGVMCSAAHTWYDWRAVRFFAAVLLAQMPAGAGDREAFVVQEPPDLAAPSARLRGDRDGGPWGFSPAAAWETRFPNSAARIASSRSDG